MNAILTLAAKDLRLLCRDRMGVFWAVLFPLLYALAFGFMLGGSFGGRPAGRMSVGVADEDGSDASHALLARLKQSESLNVRDLSRAETQELVRKGKLTAYVVVRKGFGDSIGFVGSSQSALEVGLDPSRRTEGGFLQGLLAEASFRQLQDQFSDRDKMRASIARSLKGINDDPEVPAAHRMQLRLFLGAMDAFMASADPSLLRQGPQMNGLKPEVKDVSRQVSREPRSAFEITFPSAILWGVMGCAATFAISMVTERVAGTLLRLRVAPLSRGQILAGKAVACFAACMCVIVLLLLVARLIGHIRITNPAGLALGTVCTAVALVGLMMLMSVMGKTQGAVGGAGWAVIVVLSMIGGGMMPLIVMPSWMQTVSQVSPVNWGIRALEGAIWRDFTFAEMLQPCGMLLAFGVVCFTLGVHVSSRARS